MIVAEWCMIHEKRCLPRAQNGAFVHAKHPVLARMRCFNSEHPRFELSTIDTSHTTVRVFLGSAVVIELKLPIVVLAPRNRSHL